MDPLRSVGYKIGRIEQTYSYLEVKLSETNLDMRMVKEDFEQHIKEFLTFFGEDHLHKGIRVSCKNNLVKIRSKKQFLETYLGMLYLQSTS